MNVSWAGSQGEEQKGDSEQELAHNDIVFIEQRHCTCQRGVFAKRRQSLNAAKVGNALMGVYNGV
jgi:hypothetical protein